MPLGLGTQRQQCWNRVHQLCALLTQSSEALRKRRPEGGRGGSHREYTFPTQLEIEGHRWGGWWGIPWAYLRRSWRSRATTGCLVGHTMGVPSRCSWRPRGSGGRTGQTGSVPCSHNHRRHWDSGRQTRGVVVTPWAYLPDAVGDPGAVVVELFHTLVANRAVLRADGAHNLGNHDMTGRHREGYKLYILVPKCTTATGNRPSAGMSTCLGNDSAGTA